MSCHADTIRDDDDPWELLTIQTHALEAEEDKNDALLAENQRLREKGQAVADAFAAWSEDWNDGSYAYYKSDDLMVACVKLREALAGDTE